LNTPKPPTAGLAAGHRKELKSRSWFKFVNFVNKELELFYLEKFKENLPDFPKGKIVSDESPDFLVKAPNEIVGIEITGFYRQTSSSTKPPLQQRQSVRHKIMALAKSSYDQKGLPPVFAGVHFDLNFHCRKSEIQPIAKRLVELAEQSSLDSTPERFWRRDDIQLNGIDLLSFKKWKAESYWDAPLGSFVPTISPEQIQNIFDEKNALCNEYRMKCDKTWLVIVMNRFDPASFSLISEATLENKYSHSFDAAFLYFFDYSDLQKSPFVLQKE